MGSWNPGRRKPLIYGFIILFIVFPLLGAVFPSAKLARAVGQAIIDDQLAAAARGSMSLEGALVVRAFGEEPCTPSSSTRIWRYMQGELIAEGQEACNLAFDRDPIHWPPFTFVYRLQWVSPLYVVAKVDTHYDGGLYDQTTRGGNSQRWVLRRGIGRWVVTQKSGGLYWD